MPEARFSPWLRNRSCNILNVLNATACTLKNVKMVTTMLSIFTTMKKRTSYDTNELTYETEADSQTENIPVVAKGEVGREGMDWKFGISRCKLVYVYVYTSYIYE